MSNLNFLRELTSIIPRLPCLFRIPKAVSMTFKLDNSVIPLSDDTFNFAIWAFASKCFPIELVPCSEGWQRTWWQTMHMIPGQPVSSISQGKWNHHVDACLECFQGREHFEPTFIESYHALKIICEVRSLKSWIKTHSILEEIITSSNEVLIDCESDRVVGIRKLGNLTRETAESNVVVKQTAGS